MSSAPKPVWTLVGTSTFDAALICLGSLREFCRDSFELHILSDGSLTPEQKNEFTRLPGTHVANDDGLREKVEAQLAGFPVLAETYRRNVYLKKLVDIPIVAGPACCFIDSDILFFRPVSGLFETTRSHDRIAEDRSVTPGLRDLLSFRGRLHGYLNCGFMDGTFPSLADAERTLQRWRDTKNNVVEQLIWAVAKSRQSLEYLTLDSVHIPRPSEPIHAFRPSPTHFGLHLTSWRKKHAAEMRAILASVALADPVKVQFDRRQPPLFLTLLALKIARRLSGSA